MTHKVDDRSLWTRIESGARPPVDIIYVAAEHVDLSEIVEWGQVTGWWNIRVVRSVRRALEHFAQEPAELLILLGVGIPGAREVAAALPQLPLAVARSAGWDAFPDGFPEQVVVAQWAAPRPGEFATAVEDALSRVTTSLLYEASSRELEAVSNASAELLRRLAEYPHERYHLDPRTFEETVADILARMGYDVILTPRTGDKGRDILAGFRTPAVSGLMLVECKRYAPHRQVGPEPVARVWSRLFDDKANMAMVVTTSAFAPAAKEFAGARGYQVSLQDGDKYIEWIRRLTAQ